MPRPDLDSSSGGKVKQVIQCDHCERRVAEVEPDGQVVLVLKHGKEYHRTVLPVVVLPVASKPPA